MREFRLLEDRRKLAPLTQAEEQRWIELGRTLGIFEPAEVNPADVIEVDPSDVVQEPGPDEAKGALPASPAQDGAPLPLTQNFEWVPPCSAPEQSIPLEPDPPQSQATEAADATRPAAAETQGRPGDASGGTPPQTAEVPPGDPPPVSEPPVIDLLASDAMQAEASPLSEQVERGEPGAGTHQGMAPRDGARPGEALAVEPVAQWANGPVAASASQSATSTQLKNGDQARRASMLEGERRVVIHLLDGQVRRGTVRDLDLAQGSIQVSWAGAAESISVDRLKAIFFMLAPGADKPAPLGQKIRVTFQDGREVIGFSTDFKTGDPGFFLIPADLKTNTERIFVFRWSVYSIAEE